MLWSICSKLSELLWPLGFDIYMCRYKIDYMHCIIITKNGKQLIMCVIVIYCIGLIHKPYIYMGVSENSVPLNRMVNDPYPY